MKGEVEVEGRERGRGRDKKMKGYMFLAQETKTGLSRGRRGEDGNERRHCGYSYCPDGGMLSPGADRRSLVSAVAAVARDVGPFGDRP